MDKRKFVEVYTERKLAGNTTRNVYCKAEQQMRSLVAQI